MDTASNGAQLYLSVLVSELDRWLVAGWRDTGKREHRPSLSEPIALIEKVADEIPLNPSVAPSDVKRLSKQCEKILQRLREGPATNTELFAIARKYTCRLSEIRRYLRVTKGEELRAEHIKGSEWIYKIVPRAVGQLDFFSVP